MAKNQRFFIALAASLLLGACGAFGGGRVEPNPWGLVATTPDQTELLVSTRFGGVASGCSRFENWEAIETDEHVEIIANLWQKTNPGSCTSDGAGSTVVVRLEDPLGDRELIGCVVGDCRTSSEQVGAFVGPPLVAATDSHVAVVDHAGMRVLDSQGRLLSFDESSAIHSPVAIGDLIVSDQGASLIALDPASGLASWEIPGSLRATGDDHVYACTGLEGGSTVSQVELATGEVLWSVASACDFVTPLDDSVILIGDDPAVDGGSQLVVVDKETGDELRRQPFDDGTSDRVNGIRGLTRVGDHAVGFGWQADTVVLDGVGNEIARRSDRLGVPVGAAGDVLITALEQQLLGTNPLTGAVVWERDRKHAGGRSRTFIVQDNTFWLPDPGVVTKIDATTGESVWSTPVAMGAGTSIAVTSDTVYVTSPLSLAALDRETGASQWSTGLAWSGEVVTANPAGTAE